MPQSFNGNHDPRLTEERLKLAFEAATDGLYDWNLRTGDTYFSPRYSTMLGYEPDELPASSETWMQLMHPEDWGHTLAVLNEYLEGKRSAHEIEIRLKAKSGEWRWILSRGKAVEQTADGKLLRLIGTHVDLTERKQMENALHESEQRYRQIVETSQEGIWLVGLDGMTLYVNQRMAVMLGYSVEEMVGAPVFRFLDPLQVHEVTHGLDERAHGTDELSVERCFLHKNGAKKWFLNSISSLRDAQGTIIGSMGMLVDITDRKRAKEELDHQRAFLRQVIDMDPNMIFIKDSEERFVLVNQAMADGYNLTTDMMVGKTNIDIGTPPEEAARYHRDNVEILQTGQEKVVIEESYIVAAQENRYYQTTKRPLADHTGAYTQVLAVCVDITERKRVEQEIRRLNAELEQRVQERTAELESANHELKNFAYIVSHDLKAPLRGIAQLANWLVEDYAGAFDEPGKKMVAMLISRVKRMDKLIEGILEYSRIGRIMGKKTPVHLHTLVNDVIEMLTPPANVRIIVQQELPVILGDETRIQEIFQNLIGNAVKFLDKPDGEIRVRCAEDGAYWRFGVTDNGAGIDAKYHAKIFQLFQTLSPHDSPESTGIGLAIVKKIVEFYGGKIWVESTVGEGSTFWFTLPK